MELPVAPASYQPSPFALLRAVQHGRTMLAQTTAQETQLDGAVAYVNAARPNVGLANFATELSIMAGTTATTVVDAVTQHFAMARVPCHGWHCSAAKWPADLAQEITGRGYTAKSREVRLLEHFKVPVQPNAQVQIIPARAAFSETHAVYQAAAMSEIGQRAGPNSTAQQATQLVADTRLDHLDEPRLEVFLARLQGKPVGVIGVLTIGSIGLIDHALVLPEFRRKGIGSALMIHAVEHCARSIFSQVITDIGADDASAAWLTTMGFRPALSYVTYVRAESAA